MNTPQKSLQPEPELSHRQLLALGHFAGLAPRLMGVLLRRFGGLTEVLQATEADLRTIDHMTDEVVVQVQSAKDRMDEADAYVRGMAQRDIVLHGWFDRSYPECLKELNDPPMLLFVRGRLPSPGTKAVALVGTQTASNAGIELTSDLARRFVSAGVQVVSSMVGGIDSAAHLAARTADGVSFAILDGGFDSIEGEGKMPLAIDIVQKGGVISEYAPDVDPEDKHVGEVNRMVVGFSQAVVVTECYGDSVRTLDLLEFCHEIGKMVFVVIDPSRGKSADETSLQRALDCGAILLEGAERADDIIKSLV